VQEPAGQVSDTKAIGGRSPLPGRAIGHRGHAIEGFTRSRQNRLCCFVRIRQHHVEARRVIFRMLQAE
jgi:hypothetical protein